MAKTNKFFVKKYEEDKSKITVKENIVALLFFF